MVITVGTGIGILIIADILPGIPLIRTGTHIVHGMEIPGLSGFHIQPSLGL